MDKLAQSQPKIEIRRPGWRSTALAGALGAVVYGALGQLLSNQLEPYRAALGVSQWAVIGTIFATFVLGHVIGTVSSDRSWRKTLSFLPNGQQFAADHHRVAERLVVTLHRNWFGDGAGGLDGDYRLALWVLCRSASGEEFWECAARTITAVSRQRWKYTGGEVDPHGGFVAACAAMRGSMHVPGVPPATGKRNAAWNKYCADTFLKHRDARVRSWAGCSMTAYSVNSVVTFKPEAVICIERKSGGAIAPCPRPNGIVTDLRLIGDLLLLMRSEVRS